MEDRSLPQFLDFLQRFPHVETYIDRLSDLKRIIGNKQMIKFMLLREFATAAGGKVRRTFSDARVPYLVAKDVCRSSARICHLQRIQQVSSGKNNEGATVARNIGAGASAPN